jgi:predicted amidophosphoribosyltransferase
MVAIRAPVARFAGAALDLLLPPRCLACGAIVDRQGTLCAACWRGIAFVGPPMCACCGLPFEIAAGPGALCGACVASPPVWRRARAALVYDDGSRPLVLGFKHGDRTHAAVPFARWMAHAGAELLAGSDLVVPVPLHPWRLCWRGRSRAMPASPFWWTRWSAGAVRPRRAG